MNKLCFIVFLFIVSFTSCHQETKEEYLAAYQSFILQVKDQHKEYDEQEWKTVELKNNEFYVKKFARHAANLKPNEYLRVQRFNFLFKYYHGDISLKGIVKGDYNEVFKDFAMEFSEVVKEFSLLFDDREYDGRSALIKKLIFD